MDRESDIVAALGARVRVGESGESGKPLVSFHGWVEVDDQVTRIYPDSSFAEWLEIPTNRVVYRLNGCERSHDEGRSVLWVVGDARVRACTVRTAQEIADSSPEVPLTMRMMLLHWPPPRGGH